MPAKRSPWFNARKQPPVNGDGKSLYEHRCTYLCNAVSREPASFIIESRKYCDRCQWRGLLRDDGGKALHKRTHK